MANSQALKFESRIINCYSFACYNSALYDNWNKSQNDYLKSNDKNTEASSLLQKAIEFTRKGYTRLALSSVKRVIQLSKKIMTWVY